jgi:para-nitrobenzyl esterase
MRTINVIVGFVLIVSLSLAAQDQKKESARTPIIAGETIAIAQTTSGKVRGFIHEGTYIYKGIPYAKAERFMPEKLDAWEGVRSSMAWA